MVTRDNIQSSSNKNFIVGWMVGERGIEPLPLSGQEPKSCASANFATRPQRDAYTNSASLKRFRL